MGVELLRPELLVLLLLAPLVLVAGALAIARARRELDQWVVARRRARFLPGHSRGRRWARVALGAAGIAFLALAATGPVRGHTYRAVSRKGLDLVVCIDTSRSMLAQDLRPSRLERARREVVGLLDRLQGDRVALVAFSGEARDVAPLTRDKGTLAGLLEYVSPDDNREGGTDLAAAIEHALALFDGRTGAHEAIVLLTDGEDLAGEAMVQAEEARKRNIRVFVVGVGTEAGGKIPVVEGGKAAFLVGPDGEEVVTRLERASLERLARSTGGEFLSAEQSPTPLEDLYRARIARIEGREIEGGERRVPYDRFQWPLALGVLCLLAELGLSERRRVRGEESRSPRLAAAFLPLLALGGADDAVAPAAPDARSALAATERHFDAGRMAEAESAARTLLEHGDALPEPVRARAHYALGVIAATRALESPEEGEPLRAAARDAFHAARALAGPGELRADATYDIGTLTLLHAEEVRATLPEVGGGAQAMHAQALPGLPGAPGAPGAAAPGAEQEDPLEKARGLYQEARTWLVERLRLEWRDADTRANLELVQRRLRELDEIERQREEQQQEQQQQEQEGEPQDSDEERDSSEEPQESEQEGDPEDPQQQQQPEGEPEPDEGESPPEPQEGEPEPPEPQPAQPAEPPEERVLTREEVMQLLDKLAELEAQQRALEAAMRARSRARTERDW